jgi:hypothetical protein
VLLLHRVSTVRNSTSQLLDPLPETLSIAPSTGRHAGGQAAERSEEGSVQPLLLSGIAAAG